jgi:DNA-binding MarR family transcriptional regulator
VNRNGHAGSGGLSQDEALDELGRNLDTIALHLVRAMRRIDTDLGVPPTQLSALSSLVFGGAQTMKALAEGESVKGPTMTDVVAGLERSRLARRDVHPTDRRSTIVTATPKGVRLIRQRRAAQVAYIDDRLAQLPREQLDVLVQAVAVLSSAFSIPLPTDVPGLDNGKVSE